MGRRAWPGGAAGAVGAGALAARETPRSRGWAAVPRELRSSFPRRPAIATLKRAASYVWGRGPRGRRARPRRLGDLWCGRAALGPTQVVKPPLASERCFCVARAGWGRGSREFCAAPWVWWYRMVACWTWRPAVPDCQREFTGILWPLWPRARPAARNQMPPPVATRLTLRPHARLSAGVAPGE